MGEDEGPISHAVGCYKEGKNVAHSVDFTRSSSQHLTGDRRVSEKEEGPTANTSNLSSTTSPCGDTLTPQEEEEAVHERGDSRML